MYNRKHKKHTQCPFLQTGKKHRNHHSTERNEGGHFYELPSKFPAILHDDNGCIKLESKKDLENKQFSIGAKLNCPKGISKLPGYMACEYGPTECPEFRAKK